MDKLGAAATRARCNEWIFRCRNSLKPTLLLKTDAADSLCVSLVAVHDSHEPMNHEPLNMHGVTGADESFMELAEAEAEAALKMGEVPVGCIFVRSGAVVARCVRVTLRLDSGAVVLARD